MGNSYKQSFSCNVTPRTYYLYNFILFCSFQNITNMTIVECVGVGFTNGLKDSHCQKEHDQIEVAVCQPEKGELERREYYEISSNSRLQSRLQQALQYENSAVKRE